MASGNAFYVAPEPRVQGRRVHLGSISGFWQRTPSAKPLMEASMRSLCIYRRFFNE